MITLPIQLPIRDLLPMEDSGGKITALPIPKWITALPVLDNRRITALPIGYTPLDRTSLQDPTSLLNNVRLQRMMTTTPTPPQPPTATTPTPYQPTRGAATTPLQPPPQRPPLYDPYSPDSRGWLYESVVSQYPPEVNQSFPPVWQGENQYTPPASQGGYQYTPPPTYYQPGGQVRLIKPVDRIPLDKIDWRITTPPDRRITTLPVLTTTPDEEKRKKQFYDREYGYYYDPAGYGSGIERD